MITDDSPLALGTSPELLLLDPNDNTLAVRRPLAAGAEVVIDGFPAIVDRDLPVGHKVARVDLAFGIPVLKYGAVIGTVTAAVHRGQHVHTHNLESNYIPAHLRGGAQPSRSELEGPRT